MNPCHVEQSAATNAKHKARLSNISGCELADGFSGGYEIESLASRTSSLRCSFASLRMTATHGFRHTRK
jgi:hypothetical protein